MKKDLRKALQYVSIIKNSIDVIDSLQTASKAITDMDLLKIIRGSRYCKKFYTDSRTVAYSFTVDVLKDIIKEYKGLSVLRNDAEEIYSNGQFRADIEYGIASTLLSDKSTILTIKHTREETKPQRGNRASMLYIEWVGLNAEYYRNAFVKKVNEKYLNEYDKLYIKTSAFNTCCAEKRPESIMVQPEYYEASKLLEKFIENKHIYDEVGAIYKESFLFYGEPGAGKTTAIMVLAAKFNASVIKLDLNSPEWKDLIYEAKYNWRRGRLTFILIEDIDLYLDLDRKTEKSDSESTKLKKSVLGDLFQFMDGSESQPGVVYFLTTNYINKLDKALIRPGRVNNKIKFHNIGVELQDKMIKNFGLTREELNDDTIPEVCSPSALSTYLLNRRIGIVKPFEMYILNNEGEN